MTWILLILVALVLVWYVTTYNSFVSLNVKCEEAYSTMDIYLKKRYDLIPNLVETVKGYAKHESETLESVVAARGAAVSAKTPEAKAAAEGTLNNALSRLMVVMERYPDLKANQNFSELQAQLEGTENRITVERKRFNEVAQSYNTYIRSFPNNILAGMFGFFPKAYFTAEAGAEKAPKVEF